MTTDIRKQPKGQEKRKSPCGNNCPDFVSKACAGEEIGCAIYWRFKEGLR